MNYSLPFYGTLDWLVCTAEVKVARIECSLWSYVTVTGLGDFDWHQVVVDWLAFWLYVKCLLYFFFVE